MILLELDVPLTPTVWLSDRAGIYRTQLFGNATVNIGGITCTYSGIPQNTTTIIKSLISDLYEMQPVTNNSDLDSATNSGCFYFNSSTGTVFVNLRDNIGTPYQSPWAKHLTISIIVGFADAVSTTRPEGAYFNDILYAPRITKLPTIKKVRDNLTYGVIRKPTTDWTLINSDGFFDNWDYTGSPLCQRSCRIEGGDNGLFSRI